MLDKYFNFSIVIDNGFSIKRWKPFLARIIESLMCDEAGDVITAIEAAVFGLIELMLFVKLL